MKNNRFFAIVLKAAVLVVVVGLASAAFWESHSILERAHLRKMTAAHARTVQTVLVEEMQDCIMSEQRLATLLETGSAPERWHYQAKLLMKDYPAIVAEQWVDSTFQVRSAVTASPRSLDQQTLPAPDAVLQPVLRELQRIRATNPTFTPRFRLSSGKPAHGMIVPVYQQQQLVGFLIATIESEKFFDKMLEDQANAGFGIAVADEDVEVYKTGIALKSEGEYARETGLAISGLKLRVYVWPEPGLLTGNRTMLIEISLAAGSLIGLLFFLVLDSAALSYSRSKELLKARDELELRVDKRTSQLKSLNEDLRAEICERKQAQESLQDLSGQLLNIRDEEQRRIGRELHDGTVQTLCALAINIERLQNDIANGDSSRVKELLVASNELIEQATKEVRTFSYLLHPPVLDELGLASVLPWYAAGFTARSGIQTTVKIQPELGRFSRQIELTIYRIVQEALTNIHRHSGSPTADISLLRDAGGVSVEITDYGRGTPPGILESSRTSRAAIGVGIAGIRERVRQLKGRFEIRSGHTGTTISVFLPAEGAAVLGEGKNCTDLDALQMS